MTILSDGEIRQHLMRALVCSNIASMEPSISIDPCSDENIGPASVDLSLSNQFTVVEGHKTGGLIRMDEPVSYDHLTQDIFYLAPRQFVLGSTVEKVCLPPDICASVSGRSSTGRLGLFVENAGWIDPGFQGNITLELFNANDWPIRLEAGRRVIQIIFYRLEQPAQNPYQGKYLGEHAEGAVGSRVYEDREVMKEKRSANDPCCANENRSIDGGCLSCGDPSY